MSPEIPAMTTADARPAMPNPFTRNQYDNPPCKREEATAIKFRASCFWCPKEMPAKNLDSNVNTRFSAIKKVASAADCHASAGISKKLGRKKARIDPAPINVIPISA